ncbi:hypothetical protein L0152_05810 [bacterium]|nr:hypothetical protein [bacterium]
MKLISTAVMLLVSFSLFAQDQKNTASGKGKINDFEFHPKFSHIHSTGSGAKKQTWLLLTDQTPSEQWKAAKDRTETLRQWCEAKKAPFVLVELDSAAKPQLLSQCPGDGAIAVEMISTINGLDSVVLKYEVNDGKRLKGQLLGGDGNKGDMTYVEQKKDYTFDAVLSK